MRRWLLFAAGLLLMLATPVRAEVTIRAQLEEGAYLIPYGRAFTVAFRLYCDGEEADLGDDYSVFMTCRVTRGEGGGEEMVPLDEVTAEDGVVRCRVPPLKREAYQGRGNACHVELALEYEGRQVLKAGHTLLLYDEEGLAGPVPLKVETGMVFDCFFKNDALGLNIEDVSNLIALDVSGDAVKRIPGQERLAAVQEGSARVRCLAGAGVEDGEDLGMRDFLTMNVQVTAAANPLPFTMESYVQLEAGAEGDEWVTLGYCEQADELGAMTGWGEGVALEQLRQEGDEIQARLKAGESPQRAWVNLICFLKGRSVFVGPVPVVVEDGRTAAGIPETSLTAGSGVLGGEALLALSDAQGLDWLLGSRFREWVSWQASGAVDSVTWRRCAAENGLQYYFCVKAPQDVCLRVTHHIEDPSGRHAPSLRSASLWFTGDGQVPAASVQGVSARLERLVLACGQYVSLDQLFRLDPLGGVGAIYASRGAALRLEDGRVCALVPGEAKVCAWAERAQAEVTLQVQEEGALALERVEGPAYLLAGQIATLTYALEGGAVERAAVRGLGQTRAEAELLPASGEVGARLRITLSAAASGEARFQVEAFIRRAGVEVGQVLEASLTVMEAEPEPPFSALEVVAVEGGKEVPLPALVLEEQPLILRAYALDASGKRMPLQSVEGLDGWQMCAWGQNVQAGPWHCEGAYAQAEVAFSGDAALHVGLGLRSGDGSPLLKRELTLYRPLVLKQAHQLNRTYQLPQHRYIEAHVLFGIDEPLSWRPALAFQPQDGTVRHEGAGRLRAVKPGKTQVTLLGAAGEALWTLELTVTAGEDRYYLEGAPACFDLGRETRFSLACVRMVKGREERIALDGRFRVELEIEGFSGGEAHIEEGVVALLLAAPQAPVEVNAGAYRISLYRDQELVICQRIEALFTAPGEKPWFTGVQRQLAEGPLLAGQAHGMRLMPIVQGEAGSLEDYELILSAWGAAQVDFSPVQIAGGDTPCFAFEAVFSAPLDGEAGGMAASIRYRGVTIGRWWWRDQVLIGTLDQARAQADPCVYSGLPQTPQVRVSLGGATLRQGVDFEMITEGEMVNAGRYPLSLEGRGDYAGRASAIFVIAPKDLQAEGVRMDRIDDLPYSPDTLRPTPLLYDGGRRLVLGEDYTLSYGDNRRAGSGWAQANGRGNYTGALRQPFTIMPCPLSEDMVQAIGEQRYNGRALTPPLRVRHGQRLLSVQRDYTVSYLNNVNPGEGSALAVVSGLGNYQGQVNCYFSISKPRPDPPAAVMGVAPTVLNKPDGRLLNLDDGMEYRMEGQRLFVPVPQGCTQVEGLAAGCYWVRRRATSLTGPGREARVYLDQGRGRLSVTFEMGGGRRAIRDGLAYGQCVTPPQGISRPGYRQLGWYLGDEAWDFSKGVTISMTLTLRWAALDGVPYRVEHCLETLSGSYACRDEDKETLQGAPDQPTRAAARVYSGFIAAPIIQRAISADGGTVVRVYYRRQSYSLTFLSDEGEVLWQGLTPFGAPILPPAVRLAGRAFLRWDREVPPVMPDRAVTVTALTRAASLIFRVEHYRQAAEGEGYELALTERVAALDARQAAASARRNWTGFEAANREDELGDVIRLYYDRRCYAVRLVPCQGLTLAISPQAPCRYGATVEVSAGWQEGNGQVNEQSYRWLGWESGDESLLPGSASPVYTFQMPAGPLTLKPTIQARAYVLTFDANGGQGGGAIDAIHGQIFPQPAATRPGYDLCGWRSLNGTPAPERVMGEGAYSACWRPRDDTPYRVEHYFEGLDGNYVLKESQSLAGQTGSAAYVPLMQERGFDPGSYTPRWIAGEGGTVVRVYYPRRSYSYALCVDEGMTWREGTMPYGAALPVPQRQGYDFAGWADGTGRTMPDHDVRCHAQWRPREVPYRVEHLLEDTETGQYRLWEAETKLGLAAAKLDGRKHLLVYEGFEAGAVAPDSDSAIAADGTGVVRLLYRRRRYTLTFMDDAQVLAQRQIAFGQAVAPPVLAKRPGYAFAGWNPALPDTMPAGDASYAAQWVAQGATYRVRHMLEQLDGDWVEGRVDLLGGEAGRQVHAQSRQFEGFTYQSGHPLEAALGTADADGSLVLSLYYRRNRHKLYLDAGEAGGATVSLAYGQEIQWAQTYYRPGYDLSWSPAVPVVMPDRDLTLTAQWRAREDIPYRVVHYLEAREGGFASAREEVKLGATGEVVCAEPIAFPGYTCDIARGVGEGVVAGDGSLNLSLYYLGNRHRLTFCGQDMEDIVIERRCGAAAAAPVLERPGYSLSWTPPLPAVMPDHDLTLQAVWTPRQVDYQVEHYLEALNGGWPQKSSFCETLRAVAGETVTAQFQQWEGFAPAEHPLTVARAQAAGDGRTVLRLYYRRQVHILSLDSDADGQVDVKLKVRYGAPIVSQREAMGKAAPQAAVAGAVVVQSPVAAPGAFNGWSEDGRTEEALPAVMPERDLRYVALIAPPQDCVAYQVCHLPAGGQPQWTVRYAKAGQMATVTPNCYEGMRVTAIREGDRLLPLKNPQIRVREGTVVTVSYASLAYPLEVQGGEGVRVSVVPQAKEAAPGSLVKVTAQVEEGYQWSAWRSENQFLQPSDLAEYDFIMPAGPVSLRAEAAPRRYALALDAVGGAFVSPPPTAYTYGQALTLPVPVHPTLTFTGWTDEGGVRRIYQLSAGRQGQVTLKATWSERAAALILDAGDGSLEGSGRLVLTGEPGQRLSPPANPVREGYDFAGWLPELPAVFPQGQASFSAQWQKDGQGQGEGPQEGQPLVAIVVLTPGTLCLRPGESAWLLVRVEPENAQGYSLEWQSEDDGVAVVEGGLVRALAPGEARIAVRVTSGGRLLESWCRVTVMPPEKEPQIPDEPDEPEPPVTIDTIVDTLAIAQGKRFSLPKFRGARVHWALKDEGVAALNKKGTVVRGVRQGKTTLILKVETVNKAKGVTFEGHGLKAGETYTITLMVRKARELAAKIAVSPKKLTLELNGTASLSATAAPAKRVKDQQIYWASKDPSIATVDKEGRVKGVSPGTTTLVAYTTNLRTAKIPVTVKGLVTELKFVSAAGKQIKKAAMTKGETLRLALRTNADALNPAVTYKSAKPKVATVDGEGVVTAQRKGKAVITATASDGSGKRAKITITVK